MVRYQMVYCWYDDVVIRKVVSVFHLEFLF
jgi:hypothetical protein